MKDSLPQNDLQSLERHRAEARQYLPTTEEEYQADIDAGTDPYFSRWWLSSVIVLTACTAGVHVAAWYGWGGF